MTLQQQLTEAKANLEKAEKALRLSEPYRALEAARLEVERLEAEAAAQHDPSPFLNGDYPVVRVEIPRYHDTTLVSYVPLKEGYWVIEGEETHWVLLMKLDCSWVATLGGDLQEATESEEVVPLVAYSTATWVDPLLRRLPDYIGEEFYIVGF